MQRAWIAGVDVGGTFTDLIAVDTRSGEVRLAKVPTTSDNQAFGVLAALDHARVPLGELQAIVHGTTTTTNALLERKLAKTGLITTRGFRDSFELGRRTRPTPYGLTGHFEPLIARELRLEVPERMDAAGEVITPLDEAALREACNALRVAGCESLVIHFLHSYANPAHERRARVLASDVWPNAYITCGHEIVSEYREYERGVTAAVNASVQPVLDRYLTRLQNELAARGFAGPLLVMQGNGGTLAASSVAERAVNTVMSGPASGIIAAATTGRAAELANLITYDMGGTSTDVGLIRDGLPHVSSELELEYAMPVHVPMVDVRTIGAGGGSIVWLDDAGMVRIGPMSAGARPGPICYGRGGTEPTLTDANLLLGRLNPRALLGVERVPDLDVIARAFERVLGDRLGMSAQASAAAALRIANDKMAHAIRMVSLARGHDPRDFALFAFGGAGPLHAAELARELGIPKVIVPARPGITNALGCAVADLRRDFVRTLNTPLAALSDATLNDTLAAMEDEGRATLAAQQMALEAIRVARRADLQFQGQTHLLAIELPEGAITRTQLDERFAAAYWQRFRVALPEMRPVLVNLHVAVIGARAALDLALLAPHAAASDSMVNARGEREVWFEGAWHVTPIVRRESLAPSATLVGPCIVEQMDSTIVIAPGQRARVDCIGNLIIET